MDQLNPRYFHHASPNGFMLFLDSVITSSLCPHTKDWVCFIYVDLHRDLCRSLDFSMQAVPGQDLFMIQYGEGKEKVPFCIDDLVDYLEGLSRPQYEVLRKAEAQVAKRIFSAEWDLAADTIVSQIPLPIRTQKPDVGSCLSFESWNPAVWFALKGRYTTANFFANRSFSEFIEDHWMRLSFQFGPARTGNWSHHDVRDRCRCPGYTLPHLVACAEPNKIADAVLNEILSHVDPLIVDCLRPFIESFEEERRRASVQSLQNWYKPQDSAGIWNHVAHFPALAAVSDRLLGAFESLKEDHTFAPMAEAWMQVMR